MATAALVLDQRLEGRPDGRPGGRTLRRLLANRLSAVGLGLVAFFLIVAVFAPLIATDDPTEQHVQIGETFQDPSLSHLMGTDNLGRDLFSRVVYGARLSLAVGLLTQVVVLAIGGTIGLVAGYCGGRIDNLLMRFTDLMYALPELLFIILLRGVFGGSLLGLVLVIGLVTWPDLARLLRAQALALKEREYVQAAVAVGVPGPRIVLRHILPNALGPVIVVVAFGVPRAIFAEAALSYLGFDVAMATPSWGALIFDGYSGIFSAQHLLLFPVLALSLLMLAFTLLGDGLRDALDPRSRPD
jgi:oligopeptide transport system permease protein